MFRLIHVSNFKFDHFTLALQYGHIVPFHDANVTLKTINALSPRMDECAESASLSSPTAWSSANRMATMGERLFMMGCVPETVLALALSWNTDCFGRCLAQDAPGMMAVGASPLGRL